MTPRYRQTGFTLVEILVAVIVLSVVGVGAAVLQLKAFQSGNAAYLSTQATLLAHDMSERMRANPAGVASKSYHMPVATYVESCYTTSGCSQFEMAQNDMYEWAGNHASSAIRLLPEGAAAVCIDSTPDDGSASSAACDGSGNIYAIKVWWRKNSDEIVRTVITSTFN